MNNLLKIFFVFLYLPALFASQDVMIDGTITQKLPIKKTHNIQLLNLKLSSQAVKIINQRFNIEAQKNHSNLQNFTHKLPSNIELGMNNVPVLDQGSHGTCATFATTAGLDALLSKEDYISELCTLNLNEYLITHAHTETLWDGGFPKQIFNLIGMFGFINKQAQHQYGCGGMTEYPLNISMNHPEMDIDSYHQMSQNLQHLVNYDTTTIFDIYQFMYQEKSMNKVLNEAKYALAHGDRLTVGIILVPDENVGAHGSFHEQNDTWVLNDDIKQYIQSDSPIAGHALLLTGYDDNAFVVDENGIKHQGLFTLRNSWGNKAGDKGNYYMTYDYFRGLLVDLIRIRNLDENII